MLPYLDGVNQSVRINVSETREPLPEFPDLSRYNVSRTFLDTRTGDHYACEAWYFTDRHELSAGSASIKSWMASRGELSDTTIDLLPELEQYSKNPWYAGYYLGLNYSVQKIPVTEFRSNATSGYLIVLPNHSYIAYYGRAGSYRAGENFSFQKILMASSVPPNLGGEFGHSLPHMPEHSSASPSLSPLDWLLVLLLFGFGIVVFGYLLPGMRLP